MRTVWLLVFAFVAGCSSSDVEVEATTMPATPNVLLVIADDVGVEAVPCYGESDDPAPMPHLDALCRQGVLFRNVWSNPVCSPTRATILTGRYGFRTGVGTVTSDEAGNHIQPDELTLPRILTANAPAYAHANIGKWHLGTVDAIGGSSAPNFMGWSHYSGSLSGGLPDYYRWEKVIDGERWWETKYATTANVDDALAWLDGQRGKPWVLWLAFNAPHLPHHVPPDDLHSYELSGTSADIEARPVDYFHAAIEALDTEVGRLLDSMDPVDRARTVVVFVGDNGTYGSDVVSPLDPRHGKGTLYEGGVNVPLFITGPAVASPGREVTALVDTADLFATLLELVGVDVAAATGGAPPNDSVSLLPYLSDPSQASLRSSVWAEQFGGRDAVDGQAIRDERFKLIAFESGREELYDLQADPLESSDLRQNMPTSMARARYQALRDEMTRLLATEP